VIRGGNRHRVNVLAQFVQQLAVVPVPFELGELFGDLFGFAIQSLLVHIAERHDLAAAIYGVADVAVAFAAHANAGDIDAAVGAEHPAHRGEGQRHRAGGQGGAPEKLTAGEGVCLQGSCYHVVLHIYNNPGRYAADATATSLTRGIRPFPPGV